MLLMLRMMRDTKRARNLARMKVRSTGGKRLVNGRALVRSASTGCADDEADGERHRSLIRWSVILGSSALALHMIMKGGGGAPPGNLRLRSASG